MKKKQISATDFAADIAVIEAKDLGEWDKIVSARLKTLEVVDADGEPIDATVVVNAIKMDMEGEEEEKGKMEGEEDDEMDTKSIVNAIVKTLDTANRQNAARSKAAQLAPAKAKDAKAEGRYGYKSLAEFGKDVRKAATEGRISEKMQAYQKAALSTYANEGTGADGGFAVPPTFRDEIWALVFDSDNLASQLSQEPTSGNSVEFASTETTPWGSSGIQAYWEGEADAIAQSKPVLKDVSLRLKKLNVLVPATDELLSDAPRMRNLLTVKAADAINYKTTLAVREGTGSGQPLGYANAACYVSQAKQSGQTADTVVFENLAKMYSRLINPQQGIWRINQDVFPELITLQDAAGRNIWYPPTSDVKNAPGGTLLGRPVQFSEPNPTLGDAGDIEFINPNGYAFATKQGGGIDFASSIHLWFDQGTEALRWTFRCAGQPYLAAAVSPAKGSITRSHFVGLAARA